MIKKFPSTGIQIRIVFLVLLLALIGCASGGKKDKPFLSSENQPLEMDEPVLLRLKGELGRIEKTAYHHQSVARSFEDDSIRNRKDDSVDFVAQASTRAVDAKTGQITQIIELLEKNGTADMHTFAMPDLGEKIEMVFAPEGKVTYVRGLPQNSIYYVPPVSLPAEPVKVGDTWAMQGSWVTLDAQIPFQLEMVSILKGFWTCGSEKCAEIEISGEVALPKALQSAAGFRSQWSGKLLFSLDSGLTVWSRVDSQEDYTSENLNRIVNSCVESKLLEPARLSPAWIGPLKCEPEIKPDPKSVP